MGMRFLLISVFFLSLCLKAFGGSVDELLLKKNSSHQNTKMEKMLIYKLQKGNQISKKTFLSANKHFRTSRELAAEKKRYETAQIELARESRIIESMLSHIKTPMFRVNSDFIIPVQGEIKSSFGSREHPIFGIKSFHTGIDIAGMNNSPIVAANDGMVIFSGTKGGYGNLVIINNGIYAGSSLSTLYGHLSRSAVTSGQMVKKGEIIGYEGSTGYSTGPHLHFEIRLNGKPVNPLNYL